MINVKSQISLVIGLGVFAVLAGYFSHLALTDIYHGETDVSLEWTIVRIGALVVLLFIGAAIYVLNKLRRLLEK